MGLNNLLDYKVSVDNITIGESNVPPAPSARNIDVIFDQSISFNDHISKVCQSGYFWLRNIRRVRRCLTLTATQLLFQGLASPRLDYCNGLLLGLPQGQISRLQRVQNSAARFVTCIPLREHISPVMMQLHWLPIAQHIEYKTTCIPWWIVTDQKGNSARAEEPSCCNNLDSSRHLGIGLLQLLSQNCGTLSLKDSE